MWRVRARAGGVQVVRVGTRLAQDSGAEWRRVEWWVLTCVAAEVSKRPAARGPSAKTGLGRCGGAPARARRRLLQ